MSFYLQKPSAQMIENFLAAAHNQPLSYEPIGLSANPTANYRADAASAVLGYGDQVFARARIGFERWQQFELGWAEVFPKNAPIAVGSVVAVRVRTLRMWSLNACRIVLTRETPDEFSFTYGTLPSHAESGEELFRLTLDPKTGEVVYDIRAVSRANALLAKLGTPAARMFQARFRRDSVASMQRFVQA